MGINSARRGATNKTLAVSYSRAEKDLLEMGKYITA
jgi:hypothetical protein